MVKQLLLATLLPVATSGASLGALRGVTKTDPVGPVDAGDETYTVEKHTYQVVTDSKIIHLPATAEEKSAVDAVNAYNSANSAAQAAQVASNVAAHSADVKGLANAAMHNAHQVLKEARTETDKLNVEQKDSLKRAEHAVQKAIGEKVVAESGFKKKSSASEADVEDVVRLRKLQAELDYTFEEAKARHDAEGMIVEGKLQGLKSELESENSNNAALKAELAELEAMVAELETAEKGSGNDELKIKIEGLRQRVKELEARKPKKIEPDTGSLHFELPPKKELPLRTLVTEGYESKGCSDCTLPVRIPPKH